MDADTKEELQRLRRDVADLQHAQHQAIRLIVALIHASGDCIKVDDINAAEAYDMIAFRDEAGREYVYRTKRKNSHD